MISHAGMKVASIEEKKTTHVKVFVKNFSNKKLSLNLTRLQVCWWPNYGHIDK